MFKYGIVSIGYQNDKGVERLLNALNGAEYESHEVLLIISIDKAEGDPVLSVAQKFEWKHGKKVIEAYEKRLGLRDHVLACGDYLGKYDLDVLIVFEDDMFPSKDFFIFSQRATEEYFDNDNIAGISLYTHCTNFQNAEPFVPISSDADTYFFQCAQSRGQVWFRKQWGEFRAWYEENCNALLPSDDVPGVVTAWKETSWLKYHIAYCIRNQKYFVYPYIAYSTYFGDVGEHVKVRMDYFQVPLSNKFARSYKFATFNDDAVKYNAFFENENIYKYLNIPQEDLLVDLYGTHTNIYSKKYLLTRKKLSLPIIKSWGNDLRPLELNIVYDIAGKSIILYEVKDSNGGESEKSGRKKLFFYGSGLEGKKWLDQAGEDNVEGFIDSDAGKSGQNKYGKRVFSVDEICEIRDEALIFVSANVGNKVAIMKYLQEHGLSDIVVGSPFLNNDIQVALTADVDADTKLAGRNLVLENVKLCRCKLGYASYISPNTQLSDVLIGKYSCIGNDVRLVIGQHPTRDFVSVSPLFYSTQKVGGEPFLKENLFNEYRYTSKGYRLEIGNDVWIGAGALLMEGVTIADGTVVAAGAVVVKDTEPYSIVGGNPAKPIRYRFTSEEIEFLLKLRWWDQTPEWVENHAPYFSNIKSLMHVLGKKS